MWASNDRSNHWPYSASLALIRPVDQLQVYHLARRMRADAMAGVLRHAGRALIKAVKRLAAAIEGWRQHRATYAELMSLDDRTLADIGIGRSDIPRIAAGQFLPQNWTPRDVRVEPTLAMPSNNNRPQIAA